MIQSSRKRICVPFVAAAIIAGLLTACSGKAGHSFDSSVVLASSYDASVNQWSVMLPSYYKESPSNDSPVIRKLEQLTGTNLSFEFVPSSSYGDNLNIALASDTLADITVIPDKTPSFINAVRAGMFWDLGPYLDDYPNLSLANQTVLNNASVDGKTFGLYRARALGRMGISVRQDWLERLHIRTPTTIEEFYEMLQAFTTQDPDGNGRDDTYGMVVTRYSSPWDIMQIWFGAPNNWGISESGELIPTHLTSEYLEALKFFRKLYVEGLINHDFAVMDPAKWPDPVVDGEAGVIVDVSDVAARIENNIQRVKEQDQVMDVFGAPAGPKGRRDMPTMGYSGVLAITKAGVKTEEELRRVLHFLDRINDEDIQILLTHGIERRHYERKEPYIIPSSDKTLMVELQNLNQLLMYIPGDRTLSIEPSPLRDKTAELQAANIDIIVSNPAEPLVSDIYAEKGPLLDELINDARTMYILGQIDEEGLQAAIAQWRQNGGDDYIQEINRLYQEAESRAKEQSSE